MFHASLWYLCSHLPEKILRFCSRDKWGTHMSGQYASIYFHNFQFFGQSQKKKFSVHLNVRISTCWVVWKSQKFVPSCKCYMTWENKCNSSVIEAIHFICWQWHLFLGHNMEVSFWSKLFISWFGRCSIWYLWIMYWKLANRGQGQFWAKSMGSKFGGQFFLIWSLTPLSVNNVLKKCQ